MRVDVSRPDRRGGLLLLGAVAVLAVLAAACAPSPPMVRAGARGPAKYVSLGDSWVSGPLISAPVGTPIECGRAGTNWPSLLAEQLDVGTFVDVSCGGASTKHFFEPWTAPFTGQAPPQLDALSPDTDLVTVGIGGNDVGFPNFALRCVNLVPFRLGPPPFGTPCREVLTADGHDRMTDKIDATEPKVVAALQAVRERAPRASVYLVGYPVALPEDGVGCFPAVPLLDEDVVYLRDRFKDMNAMLARAAAQVGVHFVDTYTSSIGHDVCRPAGENWVNGVGMDPPGIPMHPNSLSHRNTAAVVAAAVRAGG